VEIDLVAVGAEDKAAILFREEARDFSVVGNHMQLDVSARLASVVFKQSAGRVKSVADRDVDILVRMVRCRIPAYRDFAAGDSQVDANPEQIALNVAGVPAFDDHPAGNYSIEEAIELLGPLAYPRGNRLGGVHVPKGDLKRKLHRIFPCLSSTMLRKERLPEIDPAQRSLKDSTGESRMALAPVGRRPAAG
jgi:hypothetical protein